MDKNFQHQIAFFLTGNNTETNFQPIDSSFRPALMARYSDLSLLRYDFPLVLNHKGLPERSILSLSHLVDNAVEELDEEIDRDRIARHGYRIERELRRELSAKGAGNFANLWNAIVNRLENEDETIHDSAKRLWKAFQANGELIDADSVLPKRVVKHSWRAVQENKAKAFRDKAERLLLKLRDILKAEAVGSSVGRTPEFLKAGIGSSFVGAFDFDVMSRILVEAKPSVEISDERRERIKKLIKVLEDQRFYPLLLNEAEPYDFAFTRCSDALKAYQERREETVELLKTLAVAELEAKGEYRESIHNVLFESFGSNGLEADELAKLPDYLICTDSQILDAVEMGQIVELLAAGLPIKIIVQTDDVLEPSFVSEGHISLSLRAGQLVNTAIGLNDVFVFQASTSHLFQKRESLLRGLLYKGAALFSIFSGANEHTGNIPTYLVAAAAMESRVFPAIVYDPSAGSDWATRLNITGNPMSDDDWATHNFTYEDKELQAQSETVSFTLADFMAMDDRFSKHFAIIPQTDWNDAMLSTPEALKTEFKGLPEKVPSILLVDNENRLQKAIFDKRTLLEIKRCQTMWHSLQELGSIHNSHTERLLAQQQKAQIVALTVEGSTAQNVVTEQVNAPEPAVNEIAEQKPNDEPYIETERCSSCNECIQLNGQMFGYNENKQAYIINPDAGTFRQLVEAAEGCQVSVIHPGKPHNPKEPGLEDLIKRASVFN